MKPLQSKLNYKFKDPSLLELALTHSSYANEKGSHKNNERLEFLGDSVLGFITAEYLFSTMPGTPEGELTKLRSAAVCEKSLAGFAREIELGRHLLLGKGELHTGGAERPSILSDAFESVIAAIYLDGGIDAAREFVLRFIRTAQTDVELVTDYKTKLQEVIQQNPDEHLAYVLAAEAGPDHDKTFTVDLYLNSNCIASGTGHSRKRRSRPPRARRSG